MRNFNIDFWRSEVLYFNRPLFTKTAPRNVRTTTLEKHGEPKPIKRVSGARVACEKLGIVISINQAKREPTVTQKISGTAFALFYDFQPIVPVHIFSKLL